MAQIRFSFHQVSSGFITPLLVSAIAVLGYFIILPHYRELRGAKQILTTRESEVSLKEAQLSSVRDLIADFEKKKEKLAALDDALPDAPRIPELLANLEALAQGSGLLIASMQLTLPPMLAKAEAGQDPSQIKRLEGILSSTENLAVVQIDLILKGQYLKIKTFLQNLEANLRLLDALAFTFAPVEKESEAQDYALKIQTYYHKSKL